MRRFILSLSLCALCLGACTYAEPRDINTMDDFWGLYDDAQGEKFSFDCDINLLCDLDFTKETTRTMERPLGQISMFNFNPYKGKFDGKGHTISGLKINVLHAQNSAAGFFHSIEGGVVRDLYFDETCSFNGSWAGSLAAKVIGSVSIYNVSTRATVQGGFAGGIVGIVGGGKAVAFDLCYAGGKVTASTNAEIEGRSAGGIIGNVRNSTVTVKNCYHNGTVVSESGIRPSSWQGVLAGGIIGCVGTEKRVNVSIVNCTNAGTIKSVVDIGSQFQHHYASASGIVTFFSVSQDYSLSIENCHNKGPVSVKSDNSEFTVVASGIASAVNSSNEGDHLLAVKECSNTGNVNASGLNEATFASGITSSDGYVGISVVSCFNRGNIRSSGNVSGIAISTKDISNSANVGKLTGGSAYGIAFSTSNSLWIASIGDITSSGNSNATFWSANSASGHYYLANIKASVPTGTSIVPSEVTKRWVIKGFSNDVADELNKKVIEYNYTRWWTSNLTLGHRVEVKGAKPPSFFVNGDRQLVAEHGEVLREAIAREGAGELLNGPYTLKGSPYDVNDIVKSNCTLTVVAVHTLVFHGCGVNVTLNVPNGDVLTTDQRAKLHGFLDSNDHLIVNDENKTVFNANDPVTNSTSYTIRKAKSLVVIVDGTLTDDDIKDIVAVVDDDNTVVRVVVAGKEDDRTTLIVTVNEEQVISIKDILAGCIVSRE